MHGTYALTLRSLRQDSRLVRFHLLRLLAAAGIALALIAAYESMGFREAPGRDLLETLAWTNFFVVTFAGVLLFAPTIAEEKEEQTLGLVRMTGIGPASLLLGKALPKLLQLALVLIVQLPLVWLTRTLGGVDWPLMISVYLLVFSQLIAVVTLSMVSSVVMRTSAGAVLMAGAGVVLGIMGPMGIAEEIFSIARSGHLIGHLLLPLAELTDQLSLYRQMEMLLSSGTTTAGTWVAVGANLLLAMVGTLFASWSFDFWNRYESTQTELEWLQEKWRRVWYWMTRFWTRKKQAQGNQTNSVSPVSQKLSPIAAEAPSSDDATRWARTRPSQRSWRNAIAWKDYFLLGGGWTGLRVRIGIAALVVFGSVFLYAELLRSLVMGSAAYAWPDRWQFRSTEAIVGFSLWAFSIDLVYLTVNLFSGELRRQTWESLQILPMSWGAISRRKILGAACHLAPWVVAFLCGLALSTTWDDVTGLLEYITREPLESLAVVLQVTTHFLTALVVLTWFSLRFNPWIAILLTGGLYCGIAIGFVMTLFMVFGFMSPPGPYWMQVMFHICWIGGNSLLTGLALLSIRSKLRGEAATV